MAASACPVLGFCGGRSLAGPALGSVAALARAALAAGVPVGVGCASGADAAVLSALLAAPVPGSRVFAAFGPGGAGSAGAVSSVSLVLRLAAAGAVPVSFWAGGGPSVPVRVRLAARSRALVSWLAASRGALVCAPGPAAPASSGSWSAALFAASLGVPVFVLAPSAPAFALGPAGSWSACSLFGVPVWRWSPASLWGE